MLLTDARKSKHFWAIPTLVMLITAGLLQQLYVQRTTAEYAAQKIGQYIEEEEADVLKLAENSTLIQQLLQADQLSQGSKHEVLVALESRPTHFFLFEEDRLTYWSNNEIRQPGKILTHQQIPIYNEGENTYYTGTAALTHGDGKHTLVYCIPLKRGRSDAPFGHIDACIPAGIALTQHGSAPILRNAAGHEVLYADHEKVQGLTPQNLRWLLLLYGCAALCLSLYIMRLFRLMREAVGVPMASALFVVTVLSLRALSMAMDLTALFSETALFQKDLISSSLGNSLGDLLINSCMLLWISIVLINQWHRQIDRYQWSTAQKIGVTLLGYLLIIGSLSALARFCTQLILDSKIDFNFESVLDLDYISVLAIVCIIVIVFGIFLWSIKFANQIQQVGLSPRIKIAIGAAAVALAIPFVYAISPSLPLFQFAIVSLTFVLLLDLFTESGKTNFSWIVLWLVVLSGFTSVLLYKINIDKDVILRTQLAQQLIDEADPEAIAELNALSSILQHQLVDSTSHMRDQLRDVIEQETEYLRNFYQIDFPRAKVLDESRLVSQPSDFPIWRHSRQLDYYVVVLEIDDQRLVTSFSKKKVLQVGMAEFGPRQTYKNIRRLEDYVYAIYDHTGSCLERTSPDYQLQLTALPTMVGQAEVHYANDRSELIYSNGMQTILVGRKLAGVIKPLSLFSYLFIIVVLTMLCLLLVNSFAPYLPREFAFAMRQGVSLRNRIQISVLTLILLSFVIIGIATVLYFQNAERKSNLDRMKKTAVSLQEELQDSWNAQVKPIEAARLEQLTERYQTQVNLYNRMGHMVQSSRDAVGAFTPNRLLMSSIAQLKSLETSVLTPAEESRNGSAFIAIPGNNEVLGYAGIPLQASQSAAGDRVKDFMSTLLNVYVLLLLLAIFFSLAVSRSITRPISELVNKIKAFKLGTSNDPLRWDTNDELGMLINEYNQMIFKLDESAQLLARTEREVAWREMAKQVAHEIKNPLTPMKLSIQHLQYAMEKADLIESRQLVRRVAITLIEQIDNLSKIAAEFSSFAKMPKPETQCIVLNDLVTSVHDLFKKRDDMDFNLYVPIDEICVSADKSHLLRVLNNLIKNAVQAIPASRRGNIDIKLETKGTQALLQVTDNGKGISSEMKDKVFYPNFTTKTSGTGLGLAISKNIVESFDGVIYFETKENYGTTFSVEIPLLQKSTESASPRRKRSGRSYRRKAATIVEPMSAGD